MSRKHTSSDTRPTCRSRDGLSLEPVGQHGYHLPYYRQEDILSRYGFRIGRSTQGRWMAGLAEGVRPLVELMRSRALKARVLGVDETPVKTLGLKIGSAVKAYLWDVIGDDDHPYDYFHFTVDRSRDGPEQFLSGYEGYLQSDAYICYDSLSKSNPEMVQVGCRAHARRKFEELNYVTPNVRTHTARRGSSSATRKAEKRRPPCSR